MTLILKRAGNRPSRSAAADLVGAFRLLRLHPHLEDDRPCARLHGRRRAAQLEVRVALGSNRAPVQHLDDGICSSSAASAAPNAACLVVAQGSWFESRRRRRAGDVVVAYERRGRVAESRVGRAREVEGERGVRVGGVVVDRTSTVFDVWPAASVSVPLTARVVPASPIRRRRVLHRHSRSPTGTSDTTTKPEPQLRRQGITTRTTAAATTTVTVALLERRRRR